MEDTVDVEVRLDKETYDILHKMTKKELLNRVCVAALESKVQRETINDFESENERLNHRLSHALQSLGQSRVMVRSIIDGWV